MTTNQLAAVTAILGGLITIVGVGLAFGWVGGLITLGVLLIAAGASEL